jgi:hypothetical protein
MYMHTTQVHFCRSMSVFAISNCLCIIANALKTKTKKAVIFLLDCLYQRKERDKLPFASRWQSACGGGVLSLGITLVLF